MILALFNILLAFLVIMFEIIIIKNQNNAKKQKVYKMQKNKKS